MTRTASRSARRLALLLWAASLAVTGMIPARAAEEPMDGVEIAISMPLTGGSDVGRLAVEGAQLAIEEVNARGTGPQISLSLHDDEGTDAGARKVADEIVRSRAALVIGPRFSTAALAAGQIYAVGGVAAIPPTASADSITRNATTFRVVFKNTEQGEILANYVARVLHAPGVTMISTDDGYGQSILQGFAGTSRRLGLELRSFVYAKLEEADAIVARIAGDAARGPIVLAMTDADGAAFLARLRRAGIEGPFFGGDSIGQTGFPALLAKEPEEAKEPGWFTRNLYAVAPVMLDSANAETLAFADRFRARFGHEPIWASISAYDAAAVAAEGVRRVASRGPIVSVRDLRKGMIDYLLSLDSPAHAVAALTGPFWFDGERGRKLPIRVNRFHDGHLESAPLQFMQVDRPNPQEVAAGSVFELSPGRFARLQRVVYTGMFINELTHVDMQRSSYGADFYLWLRFAAEAGPGSADPTDIGFPSMLSGAFNRSAPAKVVTGEDGTEYRLWRVQGEFRNDFDLRSFPFDRQTLSIRFFNARADADQITYALDQQIARGTGSDLPARPPATRSAAFVPIGSAFAAPAAGNPAAAEIDNGRAASGRAVATASAFRKLTQWQPVHAEERRENLVTESALGEAGNLGVNGYRVLSGFTTDVQIKRLLAPTLEKNLLPLILMTLMMFGSLFFPASLVKEKVTVAITAALSGTFLLTALNNQLGAVGYTMLIEYAFYTFFGMCALCLASVLAAERFRMATLPTVALRIELGTRILFGSTVAAVALTTFLLARL